MAPRRSRKDESDDVEYVPLPARKGLSVPDPCLWYLGGVSNFRWNLSYIQYINGLWTTHTHSSMDLKSGTWQTIYAVPSCVPRISISMLCFMIPGLLVTRHQHLRLQPRAAVPAVLQLQFRLGIGHYGSCKNTNVSFQIIGPPHIEALCSLHPQHRRPQQAW